MAALPAMAMAATMMMMMAIAKTFNCCFCQMNGKRPAATTTTAAATAHDTNCGVLITTMGPRPGANPPRLGPVSWPSRGCPLETSGSHNVIYICLLSRSPAHLCCSKPGRPFAYSSSSYGWQSNLVSRPAAMWPARTSQQAKWSTPLRVPALYFFH